MIRWVIVQMLLIILHYKLHKKINQVKKGEAENPKQSKLKLIKKKYEKIFIIIDCVFYIQLWKIANN